MDAGKLPAGVTAVALTADPVTGGYWILKSNGGVDNYCAPWYGSLAGRVPAGQAVTAIAAGDGPTESKVPDPSRRKELPRVPPSPASKRRAGGPCH